MLTNTYLLFNVKSEQNCSLQVYNGVNLLEEFGPPKDPKKYALRLMGILFTSDEMVGGVVGPRKVNSQKDELDPVRVDLLKGKLPNSDKPPLQGTGVDSHSLNIVIMRSLVGLITKH